MESSSHKRSLVEVDEEDANISTFRRRNKILILVLVLLMISLTLSVAALIIHLVRLQNADFPPHDYKIRPLEAFCRVNSDVAACFSILYPIISRKFVSNPNQIFALSLEAATEDLQRSIASLSTPYTKCSNSLRHGLDRIREPLRVDPFVESRSDEQRREMMERIMAAEELVRVKTYLNGAGDFLMGYAVALQMFQADNGFQGLRRGIFMDHVFDICMCVLPQYVFIIGLFCSLFRITSRRRF